MALKDDQINVILNVNGNQARSEMIQLSEATQKLTKRNSDLELTMKKLEAQGAKDTDVYNLYKKEMKENEKAIASNNKKYKELSSSIQITEKTMAELRKESRSLRAQLDNTVPSDPKWKELQKKLQEVNAQMQKMSTNNKNLCDQFNTTIGVVAGNLATSFVKKIGEWTRAAIDFTKEGIKMAASAQGIQQAFERFATKDDLSKLRKSTQGLVNDMQLMKAAVRAENFNIPLNELGKLLAFAQQRARDTGESVDYLVDSIVNGIGKKSKLILDNLGISAVRLNDEIKKGGSFASAVSKIVEEEMAKVGKSMTTAADIATKKEVAMQNLQLAWGQRFLSMQTGWDKFKTSFIQGLAEMVEPQKSQKQLYDEQIKKVADLEVNTTALVDRYKDLKTKTNLSKVEQAELTKIMNILRDTIPGVVSQFDEYGDALDINISKIDEFIQKQTDLLPIMHQKTIEEQTKSLRNLKKAYEFVTNMLKYAEKKGRNVVTGPYGNYYITDEQIEDWKKQEAKLKAQIKGTEEYIKELDGTSLKEQTLRQKERLQKENEFNKMTEKELSEYIKMHKDAKDKYVDLAEKIFSQNFGTGTQDDGENDEKAKKAMENRLKEIDQSLKLEINLLKKRRNQGFITEKEYSDKVEELTIESLNKKLNIKGQEKHQLIGYESEILDAQLKQQQEADKILLGELSKAKEEQLSLIESSKNAELERLQETESDQQIYALRVATLEANAAQARLDTLRAFGESLKTIEFQNKKAQEDAVRAGEEEINKIETDALKKRADMRKLFARTTAQFEKQYNIKTWEERKADELSMLDKRHTEGLMSEESYQLALKTIDEEYEDEKRKVRQQYGLLTMGEEFNIEMETLKKKHELGLLSEEDFQKAQLRIKLKYAEKIAQLTQQLAQSASDTVKSIQEAETARIEAEYTKRQSILTEKYNQGILSEEEYNNEKEKLDYEQKVKELETQKKYADVNFALQVSQIISSTALAAMQAYAALAGIPVVGPILGAAAAVAAGIKGAAEIAKAKAERDRVKSMTIESPGGSANSAPKTGARVLKEGFAEGGFNAASDGGYTGHGGKYEIAGYVPYHHGEYIIANEELRQPAVMDMARSIESIRRRRTTKNSVPGFAEGGSNTPEALTPATYSPVLIATMQEMLELLRYLKQNGVKAPVVLTELQKKEELQRQSEWIFKR
ncbi:MAG: hypothetical protein LBG15_07965 [Dysgonamonadaceae bacterium]|jgi:hypothetical protein|nr:hypothetical protein [Dysgonamonadaceae bacterium]